MKKVILSLLALGLVTVSCQKYDQSDEIDDLKELIGANTTLITSNANKAASDLASASAALTASTEASVAAALSQARTAIEAGQEAVNALIESQVNASVKDADIEAMIVVLQSDLVDLKEQLVALGVEVDGLEDDVDDLEDAPSDLQYTGWIPTFVAQTSNFTQTQSATLSGIVQSTGGQSRVILVTLTNTPTISETSTELKEDVDINVDGDHADNLTRTAIRSVYTGTVSGTGVVLGTINVDAAYGPWRVHENTGKSINTDFTSQSISDKGGAGAVVPFHSLSDETKHILKELGFVENGTNEKSKVRNYVRQRTPQEYRDGHDGLVDLGQIVYHFWRDSGAQRVTKWDFAGQPQHQKDSFVDFRDVVDYIYEISTLPQPIMDEMWTRGFVRQQNLDEELFFAHAESGVSILFSFDDKNIYVIDHDGTVDTHELSTVPRRQAINYAYKLAGVTY